MVLGELGTADEILVRREVGDMGSSHFSGALLGGDNGMVVLDCTEGGQAGAGGEGTAVPEWSPANRVQRYGEADQGGKWACLVQDDPIEMWAGGMSHFLYQVLKNPKDYTWSLE
uniref:Uncharacterized protein n=1 Tax=Chromera velia CCMP2878 TaxID=1169474 RepID=A0A0G4HZE4_9ALVE|eukprot:Cvel_33960.t1-p1 / transcript=Cvel_33960.t1 / gene=Cvel_33960 / organism=Chromera_velia_CCMP2878 / gene_product=hypothetical protein / transcript_product=hypothetical protein / location=Cvel_scaffold5678:916-1502(+) / protein_length=113 / sequence_SO=supercontig / SO=protein_coding / is_pseudo=false